jgi:hypothetical protein
MTWGLLGMQIGMSVFYRIIWVGALLFLMWGCAGGRILKSSIETKEIYRFIDENRLDYIMYFSGIREKPGSVMFKPKNSEKLFVGKGWTMIEDGAQINDVVSNMISLYRRYRGVIGVMGPRLFLIADDKGEEIGYLFSVWDLVDQTPVRLYKGRYIVDPINELDIRAKVYKSDRVQRLRAVGF